MKNIFGIDLFSDIAEKVGKIDGKNFVITKNGQDIIFGKRKDFPFDSLISVQKYIEDFNKDEMLQMLIALRVLMVIRNEKKVLLCINKNTGFVSYSGTVLPLSDNVIDAYEMVDMEILEDEEDYMVVEITDLVFLELIKKELIQFFN